MSQDSRIRDLEAALDSCISYLKRMPLNPMTAQQIKAAQSVLDDDVNSVPPLIGDIHTPSGVLVAGAIVHSGRATVFTEALYGQGEQLIQCLREGVSFDLHPVGKYRHLPDFSTAKLNPITGEAERALDCPTSHMAARWRMCESLNLLKHIDVSVIDEAILLDLKT